MTSYKLAKMEIAPSKMPTGVPTSAVTPPSNRVNKLQEGSDLPVETLRALSFWEILKPGEGPGCGKTLTTGKQPRQTPCGLQRV